MLQNQSNKYVLILLLTVPLLVSCTTAPPPDTSAADLQAINALSDQWIVAFNQGDAAAVAAFYTEEGKRIPPNQPMVVGKESIQDWIQTSLDLGIGDLQVTVTEISIDGDMAYIIGSYTLTIQPDDGDATSDSGNYVELLKRENGTWKIITDIFNSNMPLPMPEEEEMMEE